MHGALSAASMLWRNTDRIIRFHRDDLIVNDGGDDGGTGATDGAGPTTAASPTEDHGPVD